MANNNYIPIGHIAPGSNRASFDFTGLDTQGDGYKELIIRGKVQSSNGFFSDYVTCQVNGATSGYTRCRFAMLDNLNTSVAYDTSQTHVYAGYMSGTYTGQWPAMFELKIMGCGSSLRGTTFVSRFGYGGHSGNGYMGTGFAGGYYDSTNNITSIKLMAAFDVRSSATLYGRK